MTKATTWYYATLLGIAVYGYTHDYSHVTELLLYLIAMIQIASLERSVSKQ